MAHRLAADLLVSREALRYRLQQRGAAIAGTHDSLRDFFRRHRAAAVCVSPQQPELGGDDDDLD